MLHAAVTRCCLLLALLLVLQPHMVVVVAQLGETAGVGAGLAAAAFKPANLASAIAVSNSPLSCQAAWHQMQRFKPAEYCSEAPNAASQAYCSPEKTVSIASIHGGQQPAAAAKHYCRREVSHAPS
jgi:hypothetical protein